MNDADALNDTLPGSSAAQTVREPFTFTGTGREYFGIWIVNVLLTIVTLGIYSAWAKVRSTRYCYDNTQVAGASFDYHGNPRAILKGRVIAFILLLAYQTAFKVSVLAGIISIVLLFSVGPWLIWKSLQFKLANTSYRGLRFGFAGSLGGAYTAFLAMPLLAALTLGTTVPLMSQRIKKFQHEGSRFGETRFSFSDTPGMFYKAYLYAFLLVFAVAIVAGILVFGVFKTADVQHWTGGAGRLIGGGAVALTYLILILGGATLNSLVQNLV